LRKYLHLLRFGEKLLDEKEVEAAEIVVAIATERIQNLVPPSVNWTGKGFAYNPYGEDIKMKDNFFPFGTKLYRQWIEKFGDIYNDLWAITTSRRLFLGNFLKQLKGGRIPPNKESFNKWLDEIEERIKNIHPIHAKLLTQVHIIDTQVDLSRLGRDIFHITFYGALLSSVGYFVPRVIHLADLSSLNIILSLAIATMLSYVLIGIRIISAVRPVKEKDIQRKIFMPRLASELESMKRHCMRYKPYVINNILSLDSDLKLGRRLKKTLISLVAKIEIFNGYANALHKKIEKFSDPIKKEFETSRENKQEFGIEILSLANKGYDLEAIKARIMKEDCNFSFSYQEIHLTKNLFTINLSELNQKKRLALCDRLESLRVSIQALSLYKPTMLALTELQEYRCSAQELVENTY